MTLYTPRHFASRDEQHAREIIRDHPFATLITAVDGAGPHVTHLPMLLEDGALLGHVAKPNPQWKAFPAGRTVAVFHGPHGYISPRWYERPEANVPTWNYAVVHVHGRPQPLDAAASRSFIERLTDQYERGQWAAAPAKIDGLLAGFVAFRMPIERIDAKFKMNQNRTAADRQLVMEKLRTSGDAQDHAMARWIETYDRDA